MVGMSRINGKGVRVFKNCIPTVQGAWRRCLPLSLGVNDLQFENVIGRDVCSMSAKLLASASIPPPWSMIAAKDKACFVMVAAE